MILLKTLRKLKKQSTKKDSNNFHSTIPVLRFVKNSEFMLNNFVTDRNNEYVCVIENDNNIILLVDNYDDIDIKPRKYTINKNNTFRSTQLVKLLNEFLFVYDEGSMFTLEEVSLEKEDDSIFIGYTIKDLLTNNQQPAQTN